jgi:hypothetical protein
MPQGLRLFRGECMTDLCRMQWRIEVCVKVLAEVASGSVVEIPRATMSETTPAD